MNEPQLQDPVSRPNSALDGWPYIIQLRFVNARLEKNALPREHFDRQFSVTPDRQTPESQQTPLIALPLPNPVEELEKAKFWAAKEAERLREFYAGRVILRKEEPERYGIFGKDPDYWYSQKSHWETEYEKMVVEFDKRKQLEAEGRAVHGYADALLSSPIQSPSAPASDDIILPDGAPGKKAPTPDIISLPEEPTVKVRLAPSKKVPHPQQPTPDYSSDSVLKARKSRKNPHAKLKGWENEKTSFDGTKSGKTQRRKMPDHKPTLKPDTVTQSAKQPRQRHWKISKANAKGWLAKGTNKPREPRAARSLPWDLRPRDAISYRERGTRAVKKQKQY